MASVLKFTPTWIEIEDEIKRRDLLAEDRRREKFIAARRIQAWFRGIITREHLCKLHEKAIIIQRYWRGYHARNLNDEYVVKLVNEMWQNYYNSMATRIQAVWRGFWARKIGPNFVQRRRWLAKVYDMNDQTMRSMKLFRLHEIGYLRSVLEQESMLWILYILFKLHHLLRTTQRPGVITRIDKTRFTVIERMLKCLQYNLYRPQKETGCAICLIDGKPSIMFRGAYFQRCDEEIREYETSLKNGDESLSKVDPYNEKEKFMASVDDLGRELLKESRLFDRSGEYSESLEDMFPDDIFDLCDLDYCGYCKALMLDDVCMSVKSTKSCSSIELYDAIDKMDCRLDRYRLRCPIHSDSGLK